MPDESVRSSHEPTDAPTVSERREQLERLLRSRALAGAPGLQRFLKYVTEESIEGRHAEIKEYTIGVAVFGKPTEFDPRTDTLVRSQAHRLRQKLKEYYEQEGAVDTIDLQIPKGGYVPQFSARTAVPSTGHEPAATADAVSAVSPAGGAPRFRSLPIIGTAAALLLFGTGVWIGSRWRAPAGAPGREPSQSVQDTETLKRFWSGFSGNMESPIVAFSNPLFLMNDSLQLFRYEGKNMPPKGTLVKEDDRAINPTVLRRNGPFFYYDSLTGTGEAAALYSLGHAFTRMNTPLIVKRSGLLTAADLNGNSIVFLGSYSVNALMDRLHLHGNFVFDDLNQPSRTFMAGHIVNVDPLPGEKTRYGVELEPGSKTPRVDHAIVSVHPGVGPGKKIAVLAGNGTEGTQAAAMFAASPARVAECLQRLGIPNQRGGRDMPPYFEILLRIEIAKGDILRTHYVAGRVIQPKR